MCVCHACVTGCRCVLSVFVHVDDCPGWGGAGRRLVTQAGTLLLICL